VVLACAACAVLAVATDASAYIYWGDGASRIGRANLDGTSVNEAFIYGRRADGLAGGTSDIYWADLSGPAIGRANLLGGAINDAFAAAESPEGVAVDGGHVYWANAWTGGALVEPTSVGRANLDGSGVSQHVVSGVLDPEAIAVDGAHIYWTSYSDDLGATIGRANLNGTGVDNDFVTVGGGAVLGGLAVDAGHIYWSDSFGPTIGRANLDGSGVDDDFITTGEIGYSSPRGVAVYGGRIYWADGSADAVGRANANGTAVTPQLLTTDSGFGPDSLAVDGRGPTPPVTLTVTKAGAGKGTVTSDPQGISCGNYCSRQYRTGTSVKLTARAAAGSTFGGWSGSGCSGAGTCTVAMTANRTVKAVFRRR
jgi:hypothetical protein